MDVDGQINKIQSEIQWKSEKRNSYAFVQLNLFWRAWRTGKISLRKLINVLWCDLASTFKWTKSAPSPYILSLELWNECNAGCLFCRDKKGKIYDYNPNGYGIEKGKMPPVCK